MAENRGGTGEIWRPRLKLEVLHIISAQTPMLARISSIDVTPPASPAFAQMPHRMRQLPSYRGRSFGKNNAKAKKQAAAKRARKITRRHS